MKPEEFEVITAICGPELENIGDLFALPENGRGLLGRAVDACRPRMTPEQNMFYDVAEAIVTEEKWGFVYVIKGTHQGVARFKIGKANVLQDRLKLFAVKLPFDIETVVAFRVPSPLAVERRLHILMGHRRISGEWFDLNAPALLKVYLAGFAAESEAWARVMERIAAAGREEEEMPAAEYIEYLESMLVMNQVKFDRKTPKYG